MDYFYFWLIGYVSATVALLALFLRFLLKCCTNTTPNLKGKHVLVTGGSSGLGKSVSIEAAKLGADVTIIARKLVALESAVNDIQQHCVSSSQRIKCVSLDLSINYEHIEKTLHDLEDLHGPVYMLINCAGMAICGTLEDLSMKDIQHLINLNFLGSLHTIRALLRRMKARREGHIVITASMAALVGIYGLSVYSCTKFALRGLAESLYMEVKPYGIAVTLVLPPDMDTPGLENENKSKPDATMLISESGGLYKPEVVAEQLMKDALAAKFFSTVGFDNSLVAAVCSGMSPVSSLSELAFQSTVMGIMKLVGYYYQFSFQRIIRKCLSSDISEKSK